MNAPETWSPSPQDVMAAQVTALATSLGCSDYDALHSLSLEDPASYWTGVLDFLGVVWSRPPQGYVDLSRGKEFPSWFPGGELNWVDSVLQHARGARGADRDAVVAETENGVVSRVTYGELARQVSALSAGLLAHGLQRGDRVGLLMANGVEATTTMLAIAHAGLVAVPLFSGFGPDGIVARLSDCEARGLVASAGFARRGRHIDVAGTVEEVRRRVGSIDVVVIDGPPTADGDHLDLATLLAGDVAPAEGARMSPMDPFMVIYTSGTTGRPKGAVHTHGGFPLKIAHDAAVHFDVDDEAVFCWPADMGWIAGTLVLSCALLRGATLVCYDGAPDHPDWSRLSRLVERHGITHLGSAPTLIRGLAAHPDQATQGDLSTIRLLITAGESIDPDHFTWFRTSFGGGSGGAPLINYTGGTEVSGALLSSVVVRDIGPAAFNTGSPGVDVFVADLEGRASVDTPGELAVREPFVGMTASFWRDDARYVETYWSAHPGTWVHGDLAVRRPAGDFLMLGRSDDTIKVAGKRLGPAEVEEQLSSISTVSEAATIGVPDPLKGQRVIVFIVPVPTWDGDEADLALEVRDRVERSLGKAFRPAQVHVVDELPKTRSSKVMRRVIRDVYCGRDPGDLSSLSNPSALAIIEEASSAGTEVLQ